MASESSGEKLGDIFVEIRTEQELMRKELRDLKRQTEKAATDASRGFEKQFGTGMRRAAKSMVVLWAKILGPLIAVKKAIDFGTQAKNVARDADEIQSKFDTVFGSMAKQANAWATNFGGAVGRATKDVKQWLSQLQDTFVPLGFSRQRADELSKALVTLAVDVASFNNASDSETIDLFTSALVGNHEAVRRFGIIITESTLKQQALKEGIKKNFSALTDLEKVQLRYNIIMAATADAQGDAIRTADSLANLEKRRDSLLTNLYETVGRKLVPAFQQMTRLQIEWLKSLGADDIHKVSNEMESQRTRVAALATAIAGLAEGDKLRLSLLKRLQQVYPDFLKNMKIESVTNGQIRDRLREVNEELKNKIIIQRFDEKRLDAVANEAAKYLELADVIENAGGVVAKYGRLAAGAINESDTIATQIRTLRDALREITDGFIGTREQSLAAQQKLRDMGITATELNAAINTLVKTETSVRQATEAHTDAQDKSIASTKDLIVWRKRLNVAFNEPLPDVDGGTTNVPKRPSATDIVPRVDPKAIDENRQILSDFFSFMGLGAENARAFAEAQIDAQFKQFKKFEELGVSVIDAEAFKVEALKRLNEQYTEWANEQARARASFEIQQLQSIMREQESNFAFFTAGYASIENTLANTFDKILDKEKRSTIKLKTVFGEMANAFIKEVNRMIAKWLAFQAIRGAASLFGIPLPSFSQGGQGVVSGGKIHKAQTGLNLTVPRGHPGDTFPVGLLARSGERISVTTPTRVSGDQTQLRKIDASIQALNMNMIAQRAQTVSLKAQLESTIDGRDIKLSLDRTTRQRDRVS